MKHPITKPAFTPIVDLLSTIRQANPLIHHITNYVTVNDCANITLAIGASPIMADAIEEVQDITSIAQSLVINIGTLNTRTVASMLAAGEKANQIGIPLVLDPVGAGASTLRNQAIGKLLEQLQFTVIRGNISEIRFLAGLKGTGKGVDASEFDLQSNLTSSMETAKLLANTQGCVVAITGKTDIITNGKQTFFIQNGHPMLSSITGTGCMCTSLIGSFCGATPHSIYGAAAGVLAMGLAGELAFEKAGNIGLGSYHTAIFNEIGNLSSETVWERANIYET